MVQFYGHLPQFKSYISHVRGNLSVVASFTTLSFDFEIFAQNIPVQQQFAVVHLIVEARLLRLCGQDFKDRILKLKNAGLKTEPAFAKCLNLAGDPYQELYNLSLLSDDQLRKLLL